MVTTNFSIGILIFNGFTNHDIFGPLQVLNSVSFNYTYHLSMISTTMDPVTIDRSPFFQNRTNGPSPDFFATVLPTHTLANAPKDLDIILVPGGPEIRNLPGTQPYVDFVRKRYGKSPKHTKRLSYLWSTCTGASILARAGVLDGRNATTNKAAFRWVESTGPNVKWVAKARWVVDGDIWTSSGVSAGTDMALGWVEDVYGKEQAYTAERMIEWDRSGQEDDPWAKVYGLV